MSCHGALSGLTDSLAIVIGGHNVGVALLTSRGDTITAGNTESFCLGGVAKFHGAAALSRVADFDTLIHKRITVGVDDLKVGEFSPMKASATSTPFDINPVELLDYSLNMSDDIAADILADRFSLHKSIPSQSTAIEAARLIYRFFTADTTASATLVKAIMARESPFGRDRICAGLPNSETKVFHKAGTISTDSCSSVNDLAFISYPTANGYACYSLAVLTEGMNNSEAETLIAEISRLVYTSIIVRESLTMNSSVILPAGKRQPVKTGVVNADDSFTWIDMVGEIVYGLLEKR